MSQIHQAWDRVPVEGSLFHVSADEIRTWTGREPRLMMKFDHSNQLPGKLQNPKRFVLPLRNGHYAIVEGLGYHRPEGCGEPTELPYRTHFPLKTTGAGLSEMQHLDLAFNSGLLSHFLKEPVLYPTIRGRKRCPKFSFFAAGHQLEVEGVQVEVDGGFEGRHSVTVIEAKIGECEDFHLRQLYYPFRFWCLHTRKKVRPVFFTYEPHTEIYRLREYLFDPLEQYRSPHLVQARAYRLVQHSRSLLADFSVPKTAPVPQADRLDKIAVIPFLVAEGLYTPAALSEQLEFTERQGRYYLDATRALGLIDAQGGLTNLGESYVSSDPETRSLLLCRAVLNLPLVQQLLSTIILDPDNQMTRAQFHEFVAKSTGLAPHTARRRAGTLWSWIQHLTRYSPLIHIERDRLLLDRSRKAPRRQSAQQLCLFSHEDHSP